MFALETTCQRQRGDVLLERRAEADHSVLRPIDRGRAALDVTWKDLLPKVREVVDLGLSVLAPLDLLGEAAEVGFIVARHLVAEGGPREEPLPGHPPAKETHLGVGLAEFRSEIEVQVVGVAGVAFASEQSAEEPELDRRPIRQGEGHEDKGDAEIGVAFVAHRLGRGWVEQEAVLRSAEPLVDLAVVRDQAVGLLRIQAVASRLKCLLRAPKVLVSGQGRMPQKIEESVEEGSLARPAPRPEEFLVGQLDKVYTIVFEDRSVDAYGPPIPRHRL